MDLNEDTHLGRRILKSMRKYQNEIQQIELTTGAEETHGSVRIRSIRVAETLKTKGVEKGDVIILAAVNHCDICIPYLASLYIGAVPLGLTPNMKPLEIEHILNMVKPRMIFADPEAIPNINYVLSNLCMEVEIVSFGDEPVEDCEQFSEFIKPTDSEDLFICEDFDPKTTTALLICTSGTTGLPKLVAISHYAFFINIYTIYRDVTENLRKFNTLLNFSPLYWITGNFTILSSCLVGFTRMQSVKPFSPDDFCKASYKYNAMSTIVGPLAMSKVNSYAEENQIDFPSFRRIFAGGNVVNVDLIDHFRKCFSNGKVLLHYGCTETMLITGGREVRKGSCGKLYPWIKAKIVDVETNEEVGPNRHGELRIKSPSLFTEYYNSPELTKESFDEDGWFKTGDMLKYDEDGFFYFIERIKQLIKFRNYQVAPVELEKVIGGIPGVNMVGVVGLPHPEDGEWPMAFVQLAPDADVTAQQIKDVVKDKLSDFKQLRGGVVFLEKLPLTYSGKIEKRALHAMKMDCNPE